MAVVPTDGIVGVSARYAAQIRELLNSQAARRAAAEQEAARAQTAADRAARIEAARRAPPEEPVKVEVSSLPEAELAEPVRQPETPEPTQGVLVDIQA